MKQNTSDFCFNIENGSIIASYGYRIENCMSENCMLISNTKRSISSNVIVRMPERRLLAIIIVS